MKPRLIDFIWLLLLAATALSWWLGESGQIAAHASAMALVLGLAWVKGLGVILEFMELRRAPALWRNALLGIFTLMVSLCMLGWALA